MVTFTDWLALGVIALSKCLNLTIHDRWNTFCNNKTHLTLTLMSVWIFSVIIVAPMYFEVRNKIKYYIVCQFSRSLTIEYQCD